LDGSQLEAWAVSKIAQNENFHPEWKPVILYRNGEANAMGAILPTPGGNQVLTAGHLFWEQMPPHVWTYRLLQSAPGSRLPLVKAEAFPGNPKADMAICFPGNVLQTTSPLPNFFNQGGKWTGEMQINIRKPEERVKTLISTISGERLTSVGDMVYDGASYEVLDYASMPGESGTVLWEENNPKMLYILKGDGETMGKYLGAKKLLRSGKVTYVLRLSMK
jgi:hypothetical protein